MKKLSVSEIMDLDTVRGLSDRELRQVTQTLADAANKRVKRLINDPIGRLSPYSAQVQESTRYRDTGSFFSTSGAMTRKALIKEFKRVRGYLDTNNTTRSLSTWKKTYKRIQKELSEIVRSPKKVSEITNNPMFWKIYRETEGDILSGTSGFYDSNSAQAELIRIWDDSLSAEEMLEVWMRRIDARYEEAEEEFSTEE